MEWAELYGPDRQPDADEIARYIDSPLWDRINRFLGDGYGVQPTYSYSGCSAQPGWNVKYQRSGRSLCTLYPMPGHFIALVVVGRKEEPEAELLRPMLSPYTRKLMERTPLLGAMGRWLMIAVTDEAILEDTERLIRLRRKIKVA